MRDMTQARFMRAVAYNGFTAVDGGRAYVHALGDRVSAVIRRGRIDRRATLDRLVEWNHRHRTNEEALAAATARASI